MGHHFVQSRQETCRGRIFRGVGACRRGFENRCFALARKSAVGRKRWMDHHEGQCWYSLCRGGDEALRCEKRGPARKRFQSAGAESIRKMDVAETFQLLEGPRDEKVQPEVRAKVRCVRDGKVGWISKKA